MCKFWPNNFFHRAFSNGTNMGNSESSANVSSLYTVYRWRPLNMFHLSSLINTIKAIWYRLYRWPRTGWSYLVVLSVYFISYGSFPPKSSKFSSINKKSAWISFYRFSYMKKLWFLVLSAPILLSINNTETQNFRIFFFRKSLALTRVLGFLSRIHR